MAVTILDDNVDLKDHKKQYAKYYEPGILIPEEHFRLVMDIKRIAHKANVPESFIWHSMKDHCTDAEIEWFKKLKSHAEKGIAGLVYLGIIKNLEDRMLALTGAFIRNYIDARVMTAQEALAAMKEGRHIECSVLVIPNFYLRKEQGGALPSWQISELLGLLYSRYNSGQFTILYIYNLTNLGSEYGESFKNHIEGHYTKITC